MKKETIFRHELNESIQANAALNCLKNRNKPQQMNEALPLVAGAVRLAMPLLRPLITKLVKSLVMKAGAKLTGKQVAKMVIKNVSNGKTLMKIGKKVGQTWTELPAELKQEIANTAINTFKEMRQPKQPQIATQEQEEGTDEKATFALKLVKKFKNRMTPDYAKRPEMFMMLKLQNALKKPLMSLSKEEYHAWAKAICDACASVFGSQEQEETDDYDKDEVAMQLVKKSKNTLKTSWAEAPEMFILQKVRRMIGGVSAGQWWRLGLVDWVKAICNACDVVLGKTNDREIKTLITYELRHHYIEQDDRKLAQSASHVIEKTGDKPASFTYKEINDWIRKHDNDFRRVLFGSQEQEELTVEQEEDTFNAYYSQDEPDYENDHHGIWLIINLMRKQGMLRAQGIEGRDDVDDGHAINAAYDLIEQKLNDEGMWIGDDDAEAERFVSFFGEEIAEEAMKSAIHNQQSQEQEENSLDTEYFSDLEEQEAYYENFRAIAELVAEQIDKENGDDIANNMDTLFAIVREVWNNNPDDLYIWDFDDVQEDDCYKFFDKYYEIIKNEYLKREHNNIMAATHDDLFAS